MTQKAPPSRSAPQKSSRSVATTHRLLAAAEASFGARGYHATRVDDIVERAGTSHGTFYRYFPSKDAAFTALLEQIADEFAGLAERLPALAPGPASRQELIEWLTSFIELYRTHWPLLRSWIETEQRDDPAGELATDLINTLAGAMAGRVTGRRARQPDRQLGSVILVGLIDRLAYYCESGQADAEDAAVTSTLADAIMSAWFPVRV